MFIRWGGNARHATHFLRDGDGSGAELMDHPVGKIEIDQGILVLVTIKIVVV